MNVIDVKNKGIKVLHTFSFDENILQFLEINSIHKRMEILLQNNNKEKRFLRFNLYLGLKSTTV